MTQHPNESQTRETLIDPALEKGSLFLTSAPSYVILVCTKKASRLCKARGGDQDGGATLAMV